MSQFMCANTVVYIFFFGKEHDMSESCPVCGFSRWILRTRNGKNCFVSSVEVLFDQVLTTIVEFETYGKCHGACCGLV